MIAITLIDGTIQIVETIAEYIEAAQAIREAK